VSLLPELCPSAAIIGIKFEWQFKCCNESNVNAGGPPPLDAALLPQMACLGGH
jgi:hypothetical protein